MVRLTSVQPALTTTGKWGLLLVLLMVFSFRAEYRINLGGLLVHPYLLALPLAYFFSNVRMNSFPNKVFVPMALFFFIFSIACLPNSNPLSEMIKVGASLATFLFFSLAVKSEKDFEWLSWGLMLIAATIGVLGYLVGEEVEGDRLSGINVLEGIGNKNAQSLFTLPGVFLGAYLLIKAVAQKRFVKVVTLLALLFFTVISIFLSGNRSGWLGLAIIAFSIFFVIGLKIRTVVVGVLLVLLSYLAVEYYASDIFERKRKQTTEGYSSDEGRQLLMVHSLQVGIEHPILGVGMDELHRQMAQRLKINRFGVKMMDTHFLPGYIIGSSGIIALILFLLFLYRLTNRYGDQPIKDDSLRQARYMIIFFVLLFFTRSLFSREILYSPTFISGLGIVFGHYLFQTRKSILLHRV
jgi:hypothetical protein